MGKNANNVSSFHSYLLFASNMSWKLASHLQSPKRPWDPTKGGRGKTSIWKKGFEKKDLKKGLIVNIENTNKLENSFFFFLRLSRKLLPALTFTF